MLFTILLIYIINNFSLCNGRWPTQILLATLFVAAAFPREYGPTVAAVAVIGVLVLGIVLMFASSWALSRTVLRGEVSTFHLDLPPTFTPRMVGFRRAPPQEGQAT